MRRLVICAMLVCAISASSASAWPGQKPIIDARKHAAAQKAEKLLGRIRVPSAAQLARTVPPVLGTCGTDSVDACRTRFFKLRVPVATVERFVRRHMLPRYELSSWGGPDYYGVSDFEFDRKTGGGSYDVRLVRRRGWTFVQVDASVEWIWPRSPQEVLPSTVREIDIHGHGLDRAVTSAADVERIVGWFDRLRVAPPSPLRGACGGCGAGADQAPPPYHFSFLAASKDRVASAVVPYYPTGYPWISGFAISFAIGGKWQAPLMDGHYDRSAFVTRVRWLLAGDKPPWAVSAAQRGIDAYVPPSGAVRLDPVAPYFHVHVPLRTPGGLLGERVERQRLWRVPVSVSAMEASFRRSLRGWGTATISRGPSRVDAWFAKPGFDGRATGRLLHLVATTAPEGGSFVRAAVIVIWRLSAAEREALPAGVREIDISGPRGRLVMVNDRTQVKTIVRWFNHLQIDESLAPRHCPATRGLQNFTFDFHGRHGTVATAKVPEFSGRCSPASYAVSQTSKTPLLARHFVYRVQELLGENWVGPPGVRGLAKSREARAAREAAVLLHAFRPPPGAVKIGTPKNYGGVLRSIPTPYGEFVRQTRFWRVPAKLASVVSFLQAHDVPSGFTANCGSNAHFGSAQCGLSRGSRELEVAVQKIRSGASILRVDSQVVWVYPRSPRESVGRVRRVREIDFSAPNVSKRITDPAQIARIVSWFNAAPILPPGLGSPMCGVYISVPVTLDFLGAGRRLAHVSADVSEPQGESSACNPMTVTIMGVPQPSLTGDFFGRVQREIGVSIKAPRP